MNNPVDKDNKSEELRPMRKIFRKSLVFNKKLKKGTKITRKDIAYKKPGTGLSFEFFEEIIGKRLAISVESDEIVLFTHFES